MLGKTPSAVNQQLHDLRRAGLVRSARSGKSVLYSCTASGRALMSLDPDEASLTAHGVTRLRAAR